MGVGVKSLNLFHKKIFQVRITRKVFHIPHPASGMTGYKVRHKLEFEPITIANGIKLLPQPFEKFERGLAHYPENIVTGMLRC